MKTYLSILLAVCLCLAVLAGCNNPATNDPNTGSSLPSDSSESTGGSTGSTGTTTPTGSTGSTEGTVTTEPTEGNGTTDSTNATEGTPSPDSKFKGERITEEQFNNLKTNCPTNYTYTETRTYNGKTQVITMLINGDEFLETLSEDGAASRKLLGILKDGTIKNYEYNETTGKWETSHTGKTINFPLDGFPMALSDFTFDEGSGMYQLNMPGNGMTAVIKFGFKDGQLVYLGQVAGADEDHVFFSDYGTTVIPVPSDADIVEKENTNNNAPADDH